MLEKLCNSSLLGSVCAGRTTECDEGLVARVQESNVAGVCTVISVAIALENPPPAPPPPPPSCGQGGQPECAGPELVGVLRRSYACMHAVFVGLLLLEPPVKE